DSAGGYFAEFCLGRSVAAADFDDDGDLDFAITHLDRPLALLSNQTETKRRFIGLQLETVSRMPPVGGRVVVVCGALRQVLPVFAGGSYLASSDARILAGLGDGTDPVQIEIHWPSGRVDRIDDLPTDRYWRIREGGRPQAMDHLPSSASASP
ncbi:MAG TPA: ASPIC/UnbV domain-containing protein, partial [Planctomycetaceae bacterium]